MKTPKLTSNCSSLFHDTKTLTIATTSSSAPKLTTSTTTINSLPSNSHNPKCNEYECSLSTRSSHPVPKMIDVPAVLGNDYNCHEKKLAWLRSQIIGNEAEFNSPFGKRRITYADTTASGRCLHYIEDFIISNVLPFYGNTHTSDSYVGHRTTKMLKEASNYIKKSLGGGPQDALLFCGSGTTATIKRLQEVMGLSAPSTLRDRILNILKDEERWVVFVGPYEHHSNLLSWRQSLAEVIEIGLTEDGLIDIDELRLKLEFYKNRPMLGSFSACSNVTGICSDTKEIARLLHQFGAFACFDFASSAPYEDIDMRSGQFDGYDAIFLSPHKFVGGPGSPGILLMSTQLYQLSSSAPSTCGGGVVSYVNGFNEKDTIYVEDIEERENAGTPPIIQTIKAALSFWVKDFISYKTIQTQEHNYINTALRRLGNNKNIKILGSTSTVKRQAILSFIVYTTTSTTDDRKDTDHQQTGIDINDKGDKPLHGPFVAKLLNDLFGIQARGGCACAGPYGHTLLNVDKDYSLAVRSAIQKGYLGVKPGWTRVNFPYYMSNEEFEFIFSAIEFTAQYGHRFLSLYHFNWKTGGWIFKNKAFKELLVLPVTKESKNNFVDKEKKDDCDKIDVTCKYKLYMETANRMAMLLPKFPNQRRLPVDLEIELPFRI